MNLEKSKDLVSRRKDSLRDGLPVELPLKDSQGLLVIKDRRRKPDQRKAEHDYINMKAISPNKRGDSMKRLVLISLIAVIDIAFILLVYTLIVTIQS